MTKDLKALANTRRLAIIQVLRKDQPLTVSEVARKIKLSFRSTSKHIHKLSNREFIECLQISKDVYCNLNHAHPLLSKVLQDLS